MPRGAGMVACRRRYEAPNSGSSIGGNTMRLQTLSATALALGLPERVLAKNGNTNKATNTVKNIGQADPPAVSTGTGVTPQPPVQQMPNGGSDVQRMRTNPPPSPTR